MSRILSFLFLLTLSVNTGLFAQETELLALAEKAYDSEEYEASMLFAEQILNDDRENFEALLMKGNCLQKQENYGQAMAYYKKALAIDHTSVEACTNWGAALLNSNDLKGAEKKLKRAIELDEFYAPAHYFLGNVKYADYNVQSAIKSYTRAIELNPKYRDALYMRAASYAEVDEIAKSLSDYEEVHKLDPTLNLVSFNIAIIKLDGEQFEECLALLDEIDPSSLPKAVDYYFYKAEALYYSDQKDEACMLYAKAAKMGDTESAEIHHRFCLNKEERKAKREKTVIRMSF